MPSHGIGAISRWDKVDGCHNHTMADRESMMEFVKLVEKMAIDVYARMAEITAIATVAEASTRLYPGEKREIRFPTFKAEVVDTYNIPVHTASKLIGAVFEPHPLYTCATEITVDHDTRTVTYGINVFHKSRCHSVIYASRVEV